MDKAAGARVAALGVALAFGQALPAQEEPRVELSTARFGFSEERLASFVTVSVHNATAHDLRIVTVQCRFVRENAPDGVTTVLYRDLGRGEEVSKLTYAHGSEPAARVECAQAGVRY